MASYGIYEIMRPFNAHNAILERERVGVRSPNLSKAIFIGLKDHSITSTKLDIQDGNGEAKERGMGGRGWAGTTVCGALGT